MTMRRTCRREFPSSFTGQEGKMETSCKLCSIESRCVYCLSWVERYRPRDGGQKHSRHPEAVTPW